MHRSTMVLPEIAAAERERIFDRSWLFVGHESEVAGPGDFVCRTVGGRPVILCRDRHGAVRVWLNTCPHRGAEVCREAAGNADRFTCFYHAWTFDNTGALMALPDRRSYPAGSPPADAGLAAPPRSAVYRGFVFVAFDPGIVDLPDYLGRAREYLDLVCDQGEALERAGGEDYTVAANWKLMADNSLDGYHAVPLHGAFGASLPTDDLAHLRRARPAGGAAPDAALDLGRGHAVTLQSGSWGRPVARWVPSMGESLRVPVEAVRAELCRRHGPDRGTRIAELDFNLLVFPNLVVNSLLVTLVRTFFPDGPGRTEVRSLTLGPCGEAAALRELRNGAYDRVLSPSGLATPDDIAAQESCQRGYAAWREVPWSDVSRGLDKPVPDGRDELAMRVFWRRWNDLMHRA